MVPKTQPHYSPVYTDFSLLHWLVLNTLNVGIWCQYRPVPMVVRGGVVSVGLCAQLCQV